MFKTPRRVFTFLLFLFIILIAVDLPQNYHLKTRIFNHSIDRVINPISIRLNILGLKLTKEFSTHLGLDLSGGTHLALEANMKDIKPEDRTAALESAKQVVERRINLFGVSEPIIQSAQTSSSYRIIVELPGISDVNRAVALIGTTAQLEFRELTDYRESTISAFIIPTI